jgi:hypothetical protein
LLSRVGIEWGALALDARERPTKAAIEALTEQLARALFTTYPADLAADRRI